MAALGPSLVPEAAEIEVSAEIEAIVGKPSMEIFDMSDDGSVLIGRSGSFFTGLVGALWIERVGWMTWDEFFRRQGVVEASNVQFSNPISISGTGREVVELLRRLAREQGCGVLMVTHDPRILDVADRLVTMEDGRLLAGTLRRSER